MEITQNISALLETKLNLFLEYEQYTILLTECDIDVMEDYITKRSELANKIDFVTKQILGFCNAIDIVPSAKDIISNKCTYSSVPTQWQPIFLKAQQIIATVSHTIELNNQALQRMIDLRTYLKSRISDTQNTPRIIKYLNSSGAIQQERSISITSKKI